MVKKIKKKTEAKGKAKAGVLNLAVAEWAEVEVQGNIKCPYCKGTIIVVPFYHIPMHGFCIKCDKYFRGTAPLIVPGTKGGQA